MRIAAGHYYCLAPPKGNMAMACNNVYREMRLACHFHNVWPEMARRGAIASHNSENGGERLSKSRNIKLAR